MTPEQASAYEAWIIRTPETPTVADAFIGGWRSHEEHDGVTRVTEAGALLHTVLTRVLTELGIDPAGSKVQSVIQQSLAPAGEEARSAAPPFRPLLDDPEAEHQIRLVIRDRKFIAVRCTCQQRGDADIDVREVMPARKALEDWRHWHELTTGTP